MALLQAASGLRSFSLHSQRSARRTQPVACPLLAPARGNTRLQSPRHTATVTPTPVSSRRLQCVCKSRRLEWGGARLHQSHKAQHSPQEMPESVEEMVHDAAKSISALGNFRKEIRVDFPLPFSEDWVQWDSITLPVAKQLTALLRSELEEIYGEGNVWMADPSTALNRFPHEAYERLPSIVAAKRSKVLVVMCPTADECSFIEQLMNKTGPRVPLVVVNPRWLESDFAGALSRMPYHLWHNMGAKFGEDAVAYQLTEEIVPQSSLGSFVGSLGLRQGCRTVLLKKYHHPWALFTAGLDGRYHFTESFVQHPNSDMLRDAAKNEVCAVASPLSRFAHDGAAGDSLQDFWHRQPQNNH